MKKRSYLNDWSLWFLIAINLYIIVAYEQNEVSFKSAAVLYVLQSLLIGLFNFINLIILPVSSMDAAGGKRQTRMMNYGLAIFFLIHYGMFHVVYFLFVVGNSFDPGTIDWKVIKLFFLLLLAVGTADFIESKIRYKRVSISANKLFFFPYLRIIPMHVMIMSAFFLPKSYQLLFLVLKMLVDIAMHIIYQKMLYPEKTSNG